MPASALARFVAGDADAIFVGGRVFTASQERPWARAVAVLGDRLVAVGTEAQVARWEGRGTRRVDLGGRVIVPGFIDAHAHLADAAGELGWTDLAGTRDLEDALARLRAAAARTPPGGWVIGMDWDEAKWPERRFPDRHDLDRVATDRPVVARRIDCHMGSLNSRALEAASDVAGLRGYHVGLDGRPTGILKEDAFEAFHKRIEPSEAAVEQGLPAAARMVHALGITSVHDVVDPRQLRAYGRAVRAQRIRLRVVAMPRDPALAALADAGVPPGLGDRRLRIGPIKVFSDGSLGAYTAALRSPYEGRPADRGILVHPRGELRAILARAHRAGLQTATHALGDGAIEEVVGAWEDVLAESPRRDHRHRIEHFELPDEDLLRRTKAAGLIASCQPNFVGQWSGPGDVYETRLGKARTAQNNPYRRILRRRIPLCFGSDGMPYGPLYGLHWAVNGFFEDQRLPPEDAFRAYTAGGAFAAFEERDVGTLEAGKLADFVILEGDPFREPERIRDVRVRSTWVGGECVHRRPRA